MNVITYKDVENKILNIRNMKVILDSDVAELYKVETKKVNQAVNRNEDKFPDGYVIELTPKEKAEVVTNCDHLKTLKFSKASPKAFTEKGLYMLATILKSPTATQTTLLIIDTFAKARELGRMISKINELPENSPKQKTLMARTGDLITDLIIPEDELDIIGTETTVEMNFAIFKMKKTVKKAKQNVFDQEVT
jgi:ORF6N domain